MIMISCRVFIFLLLTSFCNAFACDSEEPPEDRKKSLLKPQAFQTSFIASLNENRFRFKDPHQDKNFKTLSPFCDMWQLEKEALKTNTTFFYSASEIPVVIMYQVYSKFLKALTGRSLTPLRNLLNTGGSPINVASFWEQYAEMEKTTYQFDHHPDIRKQLLSGSYSVFDVRVAGECTMDYYDANRSNIQSLIGKEAKLYQTVLPEKLTALGLPQNKAQAYVEKLNNFFLRKRNWKKGGMMHIRLSRQYVDQLAYLSGDYGRPLTLPEGTSFITFLDLFRKGRKRNNDEEEQYHNTITSICKRHGGVAFQARLLVSSPHFSNPAIAQISFHYDKEDRTHIDAFLQEIIDPMISKDTIGLRESFSIRDTILREVEYSNPMF